MQRPIASASFALALGLTAASVASGAQLANGLYSLEPGSDLQASVVGDDSHLESDTTLGQGGFGGLTFSTHVFDPSDVFRFSDISAVLASYHINSGDFNVGSPRYVFRVDRDNDNVDDGPYVNTTTGDGDLQIPWEYLVGGGGDTSAGFHAVPNPIGGSNSGWDISHSGGSTFTNYAAALALAGDWRVWSVSIAVDGGWSRASAANAFDDSFDVQNFQVFIPEPASFGLLSLGGLLMLKRRR